MKARHGTYSGTKALATLAASRNTVNEDRLLKYQHQVYEDPALAGVIRVARTRSVGAAHSPCDTEEGSLCGPASTPRACQPRQTTTRRTRFTELQHHSDYRMVVFWTNRSDGLPVSLTWCEYLRLELPVRRISAPFYDMLYEGTKDFRAEANRLRGFFNARNVAPGNPLLDVAYGTGQHLAYLQMDYQVEGLDADPGMLALAAERI